jgi:hypothetical protein
MYQMTHATAIANAMNMPVFNGLLLIAANADAAKADAFALAFDMPEGSNSVGGLLVGAVAADM